MAEIDPVRRIDELTELAWAIRLTDLPRAHALAGEARALAIEHGYKRGQAQAARTMAMTIQISDGMVTSIRLGEEAKALFDEVGDALGRAASRDFLASVYEYLGELSVALELGLDALAIARALGDPIRQAYALSNVGGVLAASGEVDAGVERLVEALRLFEGAGNLAGVTTICSRLCTISRRAGRSDEARAYAERCREVAAKTENEWAFATALSTLAELEAEAGRPAEAERVYREALGSLDSEANRALLGAGIQVALGRLLIEQGALTAAASELHDALRRIEGNSMSIVTETDAHGALAQLCERQGDLAAAIGHLRKGQALREQIAQRDARNKLAQVEARAAIEAARKDAEIHKLRFVELHAMQAKLVEAEKVALLGTVAAGAAHELNTPLGVLKSNTQASATAVARLVALAGDDAQAAKLAAVLESLRRSTHEAVERLAAVAQSFKRFTQLDQAELRDFDVREGLESALSLLEPSVPAGITLERRFAEVPSIRAWPRELNQAFMTVIANAVEAIDGAGTVIAETSATGDHVVVRVRDTGRGMSTEKAAHLFDMAWSEREPGRDPSTGPASRTKMRMGLCAAHATTQRHDGKIEVESALGRGTTVTFTLPIRRP